MTLLPVNEIFDTIQGEAAWTGTPSTFVRLQGCPVGCPWCDTRHTWHVRPEMEVSALGMLQKKRDSDSYAMMTMPEIMKQCRRQHVVITGGEPCMYDLEELTTAIRECGKTVQIETSGTFEARAHPNTWVTLSPKIGMPGGLPVLGSVVKRASEIKMPVGKPADIAKLKAFLAEHHPDNRILMIIWLQPLSQSAKATELCVREASANGWRVSIQTHKFIGVR